MVQGTGVGHRDRYRDPLSMLMTYYHSGCKGMNIFLNRQTFPRLFLAEGAEEV